MSQIGLKDTELVKLKQQIEELKKEKGDERQEKCQGLIQQNAKLSQQVVGKFALQGARDLIWDQILIKDDKFRPYIDFIEDQENAMIEAKKKVLAVLGEM